MAATEPTGARPIAGIRPATTADLDRLIEILWSVAAEGRWIGTQVPFDRDRRRAALASALADAAWTVLVAEVSAGDGSPASPGGEVASGSGAPASDSETRAAPAVVGEVAVNLAPDGVANLFMMLLDGWRGRGIGTSLLDAGIAWARTAGAHKVALEVWPHNEPALRLYRRAGFIEEGRERRHYRRANGELWDAILMGLPLT